jgi:hypothetical protein
LFLNEFYVAVDKEDITAIAAMIVGRQQFRSAGLVPAGAAF